MKENMMDDHETVLILLVEDDAGHARLIEKNLRRGGINNKIKHLVNGREAVDYLFKQGEFAGNLDCAPLLVLLDMNMPELDGCQVLQYIKADERTRKIPVVMLTTTDNPQEIARCYDLGCNVYVTKPVEYDAFCEVIRSLGMFLSIVKIPDKD
jgi:CheY-like chemotaxis protein